MIIVEFCDGPKRYDADGSSGKQMEKEDLREVQDQSKK
jgi:hypothetical protein